MVGLDVQQIFKHEVWNFDIQQIHLDIQQTNLDIRQTNLGIQQNYLNMQISACTLF